MKTRILLFALPDFGYPILMGRYVGEENPSIPGYQGRVFTIEVDESFEICEGTVVNTNYGIFRYSKGEWKPV